jgi:tetratricopeptide (TPR) repeat protein
MSRWIIALVLMTSASLCAQTPPPQLPPPTTPAQGQKPPDLKRDRSQKATSDKEETPPEEDATLTRDDFSFNPLQSQRDVTAGDTYSKKGNHSAAAQRYRWATMHNDGNSEAWLKLGDAERKLRDDKAAKTAYTKYLELDSTSKRAEEVRKTVARLK